ncbi:MAG: hypothetical protein QM709_07595 [Spongiibacteraceae bacterium]
MKNANEVVVESNGKVKRPMVGWYDPGQLVQTAMSVVVSTIFGRHADFRLLESLLAKSDPHVFEVADDGVFWFDYTADVGDGWNSSYAIAYSLAQPALILRDEAGAEYNTERGKILVLGGDQVYPVANRAAYHEKLTQCFEAALSQTPEDQSPTVFAVPGNHDWYDSLTSFMRLFCTGRWLGGWRTQQKASYFAAKLPRGWWLIGTDIQLSSDIDDAQVTFLRGVAEQMAPDDRVILCVAEPHWIFAKTYGVVDNNYSESNLAFLEQKIFNNRIAVFIAGDLHHYRRHAAPSGVQKITAGGGGAFLHPTHGYDVHKLADDFTLEKSFPDEKSSRRVTWRNLLFPLLNPKFGVVTGVLYLLTGWATHLDLSQYGISQICEALSVSANKVLNEPLGAFWVTLILLAFLFFTDTHSKPYRYIAGALHGLSHLFALFSWGWLTSQFTINCLGYDFGSTPQMLIAGASVFAGGWLLGSLIMGVYLLISLNAFGRHTNEAFSSLKIEDWKNFLRLKIDTDGSLTIFAVGLRKVPRKWKRIGERGARSCIVPDDTRATAPEIIDKVVLK